MNIDKIIRWYVSPLECWLFVTPLYVIRTHLDRVWFWPLWEIVSVDATHQYQNGAYRNTIVRIVFRDSTEDFVIAPAWRFDSLRKELAQYGRMLKEAVQRDSTAYIVDNDDFRHFEPLKSNHFRRDLTSTWVVFASTAVAVFAMLFVVDWINGQPKYPKGNANPQELNRGSSRVAMNAQKPVMPAAQHISVPVVPLPPHGETRDYTTRENVAPLEIKSSLGANYLVKLEDAWTHERILTVFIRGGSTVSINVPIGTFVMKYTTGEQWFGFPTYFGTGPGVSHVQADKLFTFSHTDTGVSGYTVTLYKVANGNLHTHTKSRQTNSRQV